MTQLLIDPARRTGCEDIPALTEVLRAAVQRQRSPIDDVLDAEVVRELQASKDAAGRTLFERLGRKVIAHMGTVVEIVHTYGEARSIDKVFRKV